MSDGPYVVLVSEDELSEAVLRRLLTESRRGFVVDRSIVARGFGSIRARIQTFRTACKHVPHIVLTDLDQARCAPELLEAWGAVALPGELLFRIAVREVESWLLADRTGLAGFLGLAEHRLPREPEAEADAKRALINVARRGRKRVAREIVPEPGSIVSIGPLYNSHLVKFVQDHWNIEAAAENAQSLARTVGRLREFLL